MKNRVIVFSKNQNFCIGKVEEGLLELGHFDFSYIICNSFEACQGECGQDFETGIVICENGELDGLLESVKKDGDEFSLLHEQAVALKRAESDGNMSKRILFLPIGVKYSAFLKEFLQDEGALVYSVFGKSAAFIESIFNSVRCDYKIITKSPILHTIYCSSSVTPELLKSAFGENFYSSKNESVASACADVLAKAGKSLAIAEQVTAGLVCGSLNVGASGLVKSANVLTRDEDFEKVGISPEFLQERGVASKEMAFELAKNLVKFAETDLALAVLGENERFFVAIGDSKEIHVFSTTFEGERGAALSNVVDFALFRLMKVLK